MLDFRKLIQQIEQVGTEGLPTALSKKETLEAGEAAYISAIANQKTFVEKLESNRAFTWWPTAIPLEPIDKNIPVGKDTTAKPVTVVAVDGSQIMPSHHEIHTCFLLNIGSAIISYGIKAPPVLDTEPRLYHTDEDLYPLVDRRRMHIDELYVSLERQILELEKLAELSLQSLLRGAPVVALLDGSLIPWSVEKMPGGYIEAYLKRMTEALETMHDAGVPLFGYLSNSRSADLVNDLRVYICPYESSHCRDHCGQLNEEDFPCSQIWPLSDRQLVAKSLKYAERTAAFLSGASVTKLMRAEQRICFSYFNVGNEVARIEFPRWMLDHKELLESALQAVKSQVRKGMGYPVCLAEAHHLAVIRGGDRQKFFELVARQLVQLGLKPVTISAKESKKRKSFI
ncbi:MAG: DNA double-strand break repair nuclease NurA [Candidatus Melainabacteria bacterium]|nr:DNA double-strand break repair nuclease NurA [Candidatus Melainabacteria bacterium]